MKKLLMYLFFTVFSFISTPTSFSRHIQTMHRISLKEEWVSESELMERTVSLIKKYETLHHAGNWPYVGYGHLVKKGDSYRKGAELSEKQADALLRKDLKKLLNIYSDFGRDKYLLAALAYNCGTSVVEKSSILPKLKKGIRNISALYTSFCHYKGKVHHQILRRRQEELKYLYSA